MRNSLGKILIFFIESLKSTKMLKWKYTVRIVIFLLLKSRLRSDFLQEFRTVKIILSSSGHTLLLSNDNNFRLLKFI